MTADVQARTASGHTPTAKATYDDLGRPSATTTYRRAGQPLRTSVGYDADGNPTSTTDANGHTTTAVFDWQGRRLSQTVPRSATESLTTQWRYDAAGNTTAVVRPGATSSDRRVSAYSFDANNRLVDTVEGADHEVAAQAGVATGGANTRTRSVYDADGNVVATYSPRAFTASVTDPDPRFVARTDYDADARPVAQWVPRSDPEAAATVGADPTQAAQCPPGAPGYPAAVGVCVTRVAYDPVGNPVRLTLPTAAGDAASNRTVAWSWTDDNLVAAVDAPSPQADGQRVVAQRVAYDAAGRPVRRRDAAGRAERFTYSADGLVVSHTAPPAGDVTHVTGYGYDADANQVAVTDATGRTATTTYTADGLVERSSLPGAPGSGQGSLATRYDHDPAGNPTQVWSPSAVARDATNPAGTPITHTWTADGLPASTTQPVSGDGLQRRATTWTYDPAGRKTAVHVALVDAAGAVQPGGDGGTHQFAWHANDRLATQTGRDGATITTGYDAAGNPVRVDDTTGGGSTVTAGYYLDDLLRRATDASGRTSAYSYDAAGNPSLRAESTTLTTHTSTYRYGDAGQATAVTDERVAGDWTFDHDTLGRLTGANLPGGLARTLAWHDDDTLAASTVTRGPTVVADWAYRYDQLYRVVSADLRAAQGAGEAAAATGEHRYGYDDAGRLTTYTQPGQAATTATYDADSNRTSYGTQQFTYRADDTIATATDPHGDNPRAHTYQPFGGLADDGCAAHTYDGFDRTAVTTPHSDPPPGCSTGSPAVAYRYDGLDRQRQRTVTSTGSLLDPIWSLATTISYDGLTAQAVAETDTGVGAQPARGYLLDPAGNPAAVTTPSTTEHLLDDGHGTITTTITPDGTVGCTAAFDPWGDPLDPHTNDPQGVCHTGTTASTAFYRSQRRDPATGTYQLGARTYNPAAGVFTTPDSYRTATPHADVSIGTDPLTANRYTYVNGDPVNLVDPDGHRARASDEKRYNRRSRADRARPSNNGGWWSRALSKAKGCFGDHGTCRAVTRGLAYVGLGAGVAAACAGSLGIGCAPAIALGLAGGAAIGAGTCDSKRSRTRCATGGALGVAGAATAVAALPAVAALASGAGLSTGAAATTAAVTSGAIGGGSFEYAEQTASGQYDAGRTVEAAILGGGTAGALRGAATLTHRLRAPRAPTSGTTAAHATDSTSHAPNTRSVLVEGAGSSTRVINYRPNAMDPNWGLTKTHLDKHLFGSGPKSLRQIDAAGNPDLWRNYMQDLAGRPTTAHLKGGIQEVMGIFPKGDGSGSFRFGIRIAPGDGGTWDLVTLLTKQ